MSESKTRKLTPEEVALAYAGPAVAVNRCMMVVAGGHMRIAFVEDPIGPGQEMGPPHFRVAVSMPLQTAMKIRDMLNRTLGDGTEEKH